jgi:hypothetical protein
MKNMKNPNFILGIVSIVLIFIGIGLKANGYRASDVVLIGGVILGGIHWIWSITDVVKTLGINSRSGMFWLILVIVVPPLGGLFFYMMRSKQVRM